MKYNKNNKTQNIPVFLPSNVMLNSLMFEVEKHLNSFTKFKNNEYIENIKNLIYEMYKNQIKNNYFDNKLFLPEDIVNKDFEDLIFFSKEELPSTFSNILEGSKYGTNFGSVGYKNFELDYFIEAINDNYALIRKTN